MLALIFVLLLFIGTLLFMKPTAIDEKPRTQAAPHPLITWKERVNLEMSQYSELQKKRLQYKWRYSKMNPNRAPAVVLQFPAHKIRSSNGVKK